VLAARPSRMLERQLPKWLAVAAALVALATVPRAWCGRDAAAWYRGDRDLAAALGRTVARAARDAEQHPFSTGSPRFDAEWRFGTAVMAALGFGQIALEHPELASWAKREMDRSLGIALGERGRAFDTAAWGEDALATLDGARGHAACLGYANLALSLRRVLDRDNAYATLNDRISAALTRRFAAGSLVLETYPGERYPVDNSAAVASIGLRARALGAPDDDTVTRFVAGARRRLVDPKSGLLVQAVDSEGRPADVPRGSGTALAAYFLSFAAPDFAAELHAAVRRELGGDVLGFGVVREYGRDRAGRGDIDSGPLVFGWSISAMGFDLGAARAHRDPTAFRELYRAFDLFGAPRRAGSELELSSGGPLGNAILFAMLTAQPAERWGRA
jgi:hypothetical protein